MRKLNYEGAEKHVFTMLEHGLDKNLYYHDLNHTKDVIKSVEKLGKLEEVSEEELLLLKTAALYHDTGFLIRYKENEEAGAGIARGSLKRYKYKKRQIKDIAGMIMATKMPQNPKTKLQEIVCDADLDNLGREDFYIRGDLLRLELEERGIKMSDKDWYTNQIKFLEEHDYFTESAKELRQKGKEQHIKEIKELLGIEKNLLVIINTSENGKL
ncbi:HD domain-containing protein [Candidatus Pacearchaeota archaeon]|nr:HD domain-containing protein [Candidatus Pacearchaeota archaeon]